MEKVVVKFKKLDERAILPKYQEEGSSGFDFHCLLPDNKSSIILEQKSELIIDTGLSCEIPLGYEIQVRPRSGLAFKHQITIINSPGTIDSSYRGKLLICLYNLGEDPVVLTNGDRIAQGVLMKVPKADIIEVDELSETKRGEGGFGSTGN